LSEFRNIQHEVIEYIKERNKNYFDEFKKGILSQNPVIISNTLKSVAKYLIPYTSDKLALEGLTMEEVMANYKDVPFDTYAPNALPKPDECLFAAIIVVAIGGVFIGVYVSVVYARYVAITYPEQSRAKNNVLGTSFGEEEIIISIIENL
jgi:hypothetical protein